MVHSTRRHKWISSVLQTILVTCFTSYQVFVCMCRLARSASWRRSPSPSDFHIITIKFEIRRSCIELDDLVLHTSSYCSCTHEMSNLVHNEMFIAFLCATNHIDRNVRGVPFATTRTLPGFRSDGIKHSTIANNGIIGDLYGLPVRRSNDVAPPLCGCYLLRSQTECLSIHADAAEIGSFSTLVLSCTSKSRALY